MLLAVVATCLAMASCGGGGLEKAVKTAFINGDTTQANVSARPNPVVNITTVTIENSDTYEHSLRIVNLMGQEVMNSSFEGDTIDVDMSGYQTGNYMISVDGIVVKVIKK